MEHIINSETEGIDFGRYLAYVQSIRSHLPAHVYAFASNSDYFNLDSPSSLHDAWLETLTVKELASGERRHIRQLEIQLCLFGPYHDRWIHLYYSGVAQYSFQTPAKYGEPRYKLPHMEICSPMRYGLAIRGLYSTKFFLRETPPY